MITVYLVVVETSLVDTAMSLKDAEQLASRLNDKGYAVNVISVRLSISQLKSGIVSARAFA